MIDNHLDWEPSLWIKIDSACVQGLGSALSVSVSLFLFLSHYLTLACARSLSTVCLLLSLSPLSLSFCLFMCLSGCFVGCFSVCLSVCIFVHMCAFLFLLLAHPLCVSLFSCISRAFWLLIWLAFFRHFLCVCIFFVFAHVIRSVCECVYTCHHLMFGVTINEALQILNILQFEQSTDSQGFVQLKETEAFGTLAAQNQIWVAQRSCPDTATWADQLRSRQPRIRCWKRLLNQARQDWYTRRKER